MAILQPYRTHTVSILYLYRIFWQLSPSYLPVSFGKPFGNVLMFVSKEGLNWEGGWNQTGTKGITKLIEYSFFDFDSERLPVFIVTFLEMRETV